MLGAYRYQAYRIAASARALADVAVVVAPDAEGSAAALRAGARRRARRGRGHLPRPRPGERARRRCSPRAGSPSRAERRRQGANGVDCHRPRREGASGAWASAACSPSTGARPCRPGSSSSPRTRRAPARTPTVALVGKGITFDSGGLSIKTAEGMTKMKGDMAGGAAVLGRPRRLPRRSTSPVRVRGYVPLTDNMPGGDAQRVGRRHHPLRRVAPPRCSTPTPRAGSILADALAWATAERRGHRGPTPSSTSPPSPAPAWWRSAPAPPGCCANDDDARRAGARGRRLGRGAALAPAARRRRAQGPRVQGRRPQERRRPLRRAPSPPGCSCATSSPSGVPWAHLDIAGPAFNEGADELEVPAGGTGYGVRTLAQPAGALAGLIKPVDPYRHVDADGLVGRAR